MGLMSEGTDIRAEVTLLIVLESRLSFRETECASQDQDEGRRASEESRDALPSDRRLSRIEDLGLRGD